VGWRRLPCRPVAQGKGDGGDVSQAGMEKAGAGELGGAAVTVIEQVSEGGLAGSPAFRSWGPRKPRWLCRSG